jgi:hypothetical protein
MDQSWASTCYLLIILLVILFYYDYIPIRIKTVERGIRVEKLVSQRTDFESPFPFLTEQPPYWIFEIYIMSVCFIFLDL